MTLTLTILRAPHDKAPPARTLSTGSITIGRAPDNDWVLPDPDLYLSKRHCVIARKAASWEVSDLSANGTYLNRDNDPIGPGRARDLRDGDRLHVGEYEIEVRIAEAAPVAAFGVTPRYDAPFAMALQDESFTGPAQADHSPGIEDAFRPPQPVVLLGDDWDLDASRASTPRPAAPPPVLSVPLAPPLDDPPPAPPVGANLMAAFLRGAGLPDARPADPEAAMEALGAAFRALVSGLRKALVARAATKGEFRIRQTMIRAQGNNPLKFAASEDDALLALLGAGRRTDKGPAESVAEAMQDISLHELATMAAMQAAVRGLLRDFAPVKLREEADKSGLSVLDAQRKLRAWDLFEARHAKLIEGLADDFDSVFGRAFAVAYEQAVLDAQSSRSRS
jgi:type VI secretion system protein ImpI/type VI secretion system protein